MPLELTQCNWTGDKNEHEPTWAKPLHGAPPGLPQVTSTCGPSRASREPHIKTLTCDTCSPSSHFQERPGEISLIWGT